MSKVFPNTKGKDRGLTGRLVSVSQVGRVWVLTGSWLGRKGVPFLASQIRLRHDA